MLTTRKVIITVIAIAAVSLIGAVLSLLRTPGSDGYGVNSLGNRMHGQKALYDTLGELNVVRRRGVTPPDNQLPTARTMVLLNPNPSIVGIEPVYLREIATWVKEGGRLVIAPSPDDSLTPFAFDEDYIADPMELLALVGVEGGLNVEQSDWVGNSVTDVDTTVSSSSPDRVSFQRQLEESILLRTVPAETADAITDGALADLAPDALKLSIPAKEPRILEISGAKPDGQLKVRTADGTDLTLAALFRSGKGEIVVVSDPRLFENRFIALDDNAVLAHRLIASGGGPIVFDEFYHGLTVRGNPFYLLTYPAYSLIVIAIVLVLALWIWKSLIPFGPALELAPVGRRSIAEYVDSMARLFDRSRHSRRFLLEEFRAGSLWTLRHELGLSPRREQPEEIAAAIARHDPQKAQAFLQAIRSLDELIARDLPPNEHDTVTTLQRIKHCL